MTALPMAPCGRRFATATEYADRRATSRTGCDTYRLGDSGGSDMPSDIPSVAILNDYASVALELADWSPVQSRSAVTVFDRHLTEDEAADVLASFDVVCTLRERMAFPRTLIERLPNLKLITIVGMSLPNLDMAAPSEHGIVVAHSNFANPLFAAGRQATPEFAWGLLIATVRHLAQ